MFNLDVGLMIWTCLSFFVLLFLLKKLAYKPLLKVIDEREGTIRESIEGAEKARVKAEEMIGEQKKQLENAKLEVKKMVDEGRISGENVKKDVIAKAREEAGEIISRAKADIGKEKEKAISDLQDEVADLAINVASKVLNKILNKEEHIELLNKSIADIKVS